MLKNIIMPIKDRLANWLQHGKEYKNQPKTGLVSISTHAEMSMLRHHAHLSEICQLILKSVSGAAAEVNKVGCWCLQCTFFIWFGLKTILREPEIVATLHLQIFEIKCSNKMYYFYLWLDSTETI
jgi:hypothetical protein